MIFKVNLFSQKVLQALICFYLNDSYTLLFIFHFRHIQPLNVLKDTRNFSLLKFLRNVVYLINLMKVMWLEMVWLFSSYYSSRNLFYPAFGVLSFKIVSTKSAIFPEQLRSIFFL